MPLKKLHVRPEIWLKYTAKAPTPWSAEAVKHDIEALAQMKRTTEPMPSCNQLSRRWGWSVDRVVKAMEKHGPNAVELIEMSEVAPKKAPKTKKKTTSKRTKK